MTKPKATRGRPPRPGGRKSINMRLHAPLIARIQKLRVERKQTLTVIVEDLLTRGLMDLAEPVSK